MLSRFLPREEKFFDLFKRSADLLVDGSIELQQLLGDLGKSESRARKIKDLESRADEITHRTVELLHTTFITPLDREDIHQLITKMDDILDFIEAAAERISLYEIKSTTPQLNDLADIIVKSTEGLRTAITRIESLKEPEEIVKQCVEVNRLENEADQVFRKGMAQLFRDEPDVRQLIKMKEIYEMLETVTDRCEDVANIVEGIVLEYA
jgi:uncharacterized protein